LQPAAAASDTRTANAGTETTGHDWSDPVAAGAERAPSRLSTRCLNTTDVLPSDNPARTACAEEKRPLRSVRASEEIVGPAPEQRGRAVAVEIPGVVRKTVSRGSITSR